MKKILVLYLILQSSFVFSKTAEEHYKDAEAYSQKAKQNYIYAAIAFAVVIGGRYLTRKFNDDSNKKD